MEPEKSKILSLESLRGLAAFVVILDHFFRTFYPATFANGNITHSNYEWLFIKTPLFAVVNGSFAVVVFFVLSGFVLSYGYFKKGSADFVSSVIKRYFRLMPIVLGSILLAFLLLKLNLFFNSKAGIMPFSWRDNTISFGQALWQGLIGVFMVQPGDASLNSPLWTIYYEMLGSVLVYSLLALLGKDKRRVMVYPFLILIFINTYFIGFIVGIILADLYCNRQNIFAYISRAPAVIKCVALSLAIWMASFPPLRTNDTTALIHRPLLFIEDYGLNATIVHLAGAIIIILLILSSHRLNKIFEFKPFLALGSVSYSLYATHLIVLGSIASLVFFITTQHFHLPYNTSAMITFALYIPSALAVAAIFRKYIDKPSIKLSKIVGDKIKLLAKNNDGLKYSN